MFINISQLDMSKVGSEVEKPNNLPAMMVRYIRCILCLSKTISQPIAFGECTKVHDYQGITSLDVFANYEAFSTRNQGQESALEKLAVVVAFGSGILVICFSVFLFF